MQVYLESYPSTHQEGEGDVVDSSSLHEEGETAVLPHTHTPQWLILHPRLPTTWRHTLLSELTPEGLEDLRLHRVDLPHRPVVWVESLVPHHTAARHTQLTMATTGWVLSHQPQGGLQP